MRIQTADQNDLREILDLQILAYQSEACLLNNPNIPPLKQTLEDVQSEYKAGTYLKAVDETGAIVGSVRAYAKDGTLYIGKLIVRPDRQGRGIGSALLTQIERECLHSRYELFTSSKSAKNLRLYERLGYRVFAEKEVSCDLKFVYLEKTEQNNI